MGTDTGKENKDQTVIFQESITDKNLLTSGLVWIISLSVLDLTQALPVGGHVFRLD